MKTQKFFLIAIALVFIQSSPKIESLVEYNRNIVTTNGILNVTSDGRTARQMISDLRKGGYDISGWAKDAMNQKAFVTTKGKVYKLVVIKGKEFSVKERTLENIRAEAKRRGYKTPPAEVAPLLREKLTDEQIEQMGLIWLVVMHESIKIDDARVPLLFELGPRGSVGGCLHVCYDFWHREPSEKVGLVFLAPPQEVK